MDCEHPEILRCVGSKDREITHMIEMPACVIDVTAMLRGTEYALLWLGEDNLSHRQILYEEFIP